MAAYISAVFVLTFSVFATANAPTPKKFAKSPSPTEIPIVQQAVLGQATVTSHVTRVIDGDTFEIESGQKVRMIGINTPEAVDTRKPVECYGKEASAHAKELLLDQDVVLVKDISETDPYGRLLRYVYVGNNFINKSLVEDGYAFATSYPPDIAYQKEFQAAERDASFNKRGLWGAGCTK